MTAVVTGDKGTNDEVSDNITYSTDDGGTWTYTNIDLNQKQNNWQTDTTTKVGDILLSSIDVSSLGTNKHYTLTYKATVTTGSNLEVVIAE